MLKFRDFNLEFDLFDAEMAEDYEAALTKLQNALDKKPAKETLADGIRRQCTIVFAFFDDLFGEGFHKDVFGERTNLVQCLDAFAEFTRLVNDQKNALSERVSELKAQAPVPSPNRAARRAQTGDK